MLKGTFAFFKWGFVLLVAVQPIGLNAQQIISTADFNFLKGITQAVLDSSRIYPGQQLVAPYGANNTGGVLIRPGGRETYPSFWIRDHAMTLETGLVGQDEQKHMLMLTAATQCDQTWITDAGSMVPFGAIADHVRVDDLLPIYFPGTYDYVAQGGTDFGMFPPYCDQYYFIHMAHYYISDANDVDILQEEINGTSLIDRLEIAFKVPPSRQDNHIVYTNDAFRGVDFGFRDAIYITGDLSYSSILKYRAALQLSALFEQIGNNSKAKAYRDIASKIKAVLPVAFADKNGMLKASTAIGSHPDVWATALAVYLGILDGDHALKAARHLAKAYVAGTLAYKGNIRHIIDGEGYNGTPYWEKGIVHPNQFQNGAYWGTPTGWVAYTIAQVDNKLAAQLVKEYISELRESDFRQGSEFDGPYECFYPPNYTRGPVYLTTVSAPFIVLKSMLQ